MKKTVSFKDAIYPDRVQAQLGLSDDEMKAKHAIIIGDDRTLCGMAYGEYVGEDKISKVTCGSCISAIQYAKSFKKGKDY